jgi:GTP-binding protein
VPIPRVAIVGRPNVGKSSLLNMIAGAKVSIVDPTPGTTRDRVSVILDLDPPLRDGGAIKPVEIIDTGGYGAYEAPGERYNEIGVDLAPLRAQIESQIALAVSSADLILFCIDAQAGITPLDEEVARLLREGKLPGGKRGAKLPPIQIIATKVDGPKWEAHGLEIAALGLGEPWLVSSTSNYMRRDLLDGLYERLPAPAKDEPAPHADLRVAIIGKRNAGKSSFVNALAGEQRVIVSEIAGTTRDAIDVHVTLDARSVLLIDTAGLRRKKSFANQIEWWAFDRAKRSIDRADVVLLLIDATEPTSQVDEQLAMLCQKTYKPVVLVVNKWDLAEGGANEKGEPATPQAYEEYLRRELKGLAYAPIVFTSAETGLNLRAAIDLAFELHEQASQRVGTGKLNRLVREILERHNPPSKLGTFAKVFYVSQVRADPPTIVLVVNKPELFTPNYQKFLINRFREELPFGEVPIRLLVRGRKPQKGGGIDLTLEDREVDAHEAAEIEAEAVAMANAPEDEMDADAYFEDDQE